MDLVPGEPAAEDETLNEFVECRAIVFKDSPRSVALLLKHVFNTPTESQIELTSLDHRRRIAVSVRSQSFSHPDAREDISHQVRRLGQVCDYTVSMGAVDQPLRCQASEEMRHTVGIPLIVAAAVTRPHSGRPGDLPLRFGIAIPGYEDFMHRRSQVRRDDGMTNFVDSDMAEVILGTPFTARQRGSDMMRPNFPSLAPSKPAGVTSQSLQVSARHAFGFPLEEIQGKAFRDAEVLAQDRLAGVGGRKTDFDVTIQTSRAAECCIDAGRIVGRSNYDHARAFDCAIQALEE